ncbi:(d)CMP kinase [Candidatus Neomarinimicrobiota bacterium]
MGTVVAIDGPSASGKSTTARMVAERLGYLHLDTGAMYRAVTFTCLENEIPPEENAAVSKLLESLDIRFQFQNGHQRTMLDGRDVTREIRGAQVTENVSAYSALRVVRERMVVLQRAFGAEHNVVCEGRDIGTRVFPAANFKFFLEADLEVRAKRRYEELITLGESPSLKVIKQDIHQRDAADSSREFSPLRKAEDAIIIDTTNLTVRRQVDKIVNLVEKGLKKASS